MTAVPDPRPTGGTEIPYLEFVGLMALLMALNSAAIDVYIPALQEIGSTFGISDGNARQLVITAYVMGFGGAQVIYGPLSDRFGRRPVLFAGLGIYLIGALAAVVVPSFEALLLTRFIQGIGAASTRVIATAAVRDRFSGSRMASVMSLVMMIFMIMPVLAPNLGSLILLFGNWREVSGFMVVFGGVAFVWAYFRMTETLHPEDRRELRLKPVAEAFRIVLTNRVSVGYLFAMGSFFAFIFAFIAQAEQIYTQIYGMGTEFTLWFSVTASFARRWPPSAVAARLSCCRKRWSGGWSNAAMMRISRSGASTRSRASESTAFPKATRPASRNWSMCPAG